MRQRNDAAMDLLDDLWAQGLGQPPEGLGIGHLFGSDPGELAVQQIAARFPFQVGKAPVPNVLQEQHPEYHFRRSTWPTVRATVWAAALQSVMDNLQ